MTSVTISFKTLALLTIIICLQQCSEGNSAENSKDDAHSLLDSHFKAKSRHFWSQSSLKDYTVSYISLARLVIEEDKFYHFLKLSVLPVIVKNIGNPSFDKLYERVIKYIQSYDKEVLEVTERLHFRPPVHLFSSNILNITDLPGNQNISTINKFNILNHPFSIFMMLSRFASQFQEIARLLAKVKSFAFLDPYFTNSRNWPSVNDVGVFAQLICRIQSTYEYPLDEFVNGQFNDFITNVKLEAVHAKVMGQIAIQAELPAVGLQWLLQALRMAKAENKSEVTQYKSIAVEAAIFHYTDWMETIPEKVFYFQDRHFGFDVDTARKNGAKIQNPEKPNIAKLLMLTPSAISKETFKYSLEQKYGRQRKFYKKEHNVFNVVNFWSLCQDGNWQTPAEQRLLTCWMDTTAIPIFPFKFELLSKDPPLIKVHQIVTKTTVIELLKQSGGSLTNAMIFGPNLRASNPEGSVAYAEHDHQRRASTAAWLDTLPAALQTKLERTVEIVTKLKLLPAGHKDAENFQLATAIPGGHFITHLDIYISMYKRMATLMIYLSDTELGGRTAFPGLGLSVAPEANSGIFWFNLLKNGHVDERLIHGGCPVVLGHKAVLTKWIAPHESFLSRPCSLEPHE